jgi:hypothetical protein
MLDKLRLAFFYGRSKSFAPKIPPEKLGQV